MGRAVLLYDDGCGFCRWSAAKIRSWDRGRLRFVPLGSPEAAVLLPGMDPERMTASFHLVTGNGQVHSAGAAIAPLARLLPAGAPISFVARAFPALTERAYRWVSGHRDRLGRALGERACSVDPSGSAPTRPRPGPTGRRRRSRG